MSEKAEAERLLAAILSHLPRNTNRVFAVVKLQMSHCLLYIPLRNEQIKNRQKIKELYQELADKALL